MTYLINISGLDLATGGPSPLQRSLVGNDALREVVLEVMFDPYVQYTVYLQAITGGGVSEVVMEMKTSEEGG